MRWLLGIDLVGRSNGALEMATWLAQTAKEPARFVAVHVIDERRWGPRDVAEALRPSAQEALTRELAASALPAGAVDPKVVIARTVTEGLADAAAANDCEGIIIGRVAASRERALVRLGGVARRLLRLLPLPVLVVPPDLSAAAVGAGAMVLATDLASDSAAAGRMARRIAGDIDRGLVVVHVDSSYFVVPDYVGGGGIIIPRKPKHVRADVEAWARTCGVDAPVIRLSDGDIVEQLLAEAQRESSPMLVAGSRRLTLGERIFSSSVGNDLARLADRPVLVVPPID